MPFERRDIAERSIFPKHIFSLPPTVVQILGGGEGSVVIYTARVAAEVLPATSGLYLLDGVYLQPGFRVFENTTNRIWEVAVRDWSLLQEVQGPALVIIQEGTRFGGSVHVVAENGWTRCHLAYVGRSGSVVYTLGPVDWTPIELTEELVPSYWVTPAPFGFTTDYRAAGLYSIHVHIYAVPTGATGGTWTGALELGILENGLPIPTEQPFDVRWRETGQDAVTLQASLLWRIQPLSNYTIALRSNPAGEFAVKAYVGLHRLI